MCIRDSCKPKLETAAKAWILAGGSHHTVFTQALSTECIEDLADMTKVELLIINKQTEIRNFKAIMAGNDHYFDK